MSFFTNEMEAKKLQHPLNGYLEKGSILKKWNGSRKIIAYENLCLSRRGTILKDEMEADKRIEYGNWYLPRNRIFFKKEWNLLTE